RFVAKNLVAAGVARRCEVQVAYAIGVAKPMGVYVNTFGTGKVDDQTLAAYISKEFDFRPRALIEELKLLRPIYAPTAAYGHFGRKEFNWEKTSRAKKIASDLLNSKTRRAAAPKAKPQEQPAREGKKRRGRVPQSSRRPRTARKAS